ncbi:N-acetylmuramic acid 6-phosphate etherase [Thalassococcus sp. BH17M4-6]|uniref:N-acetylmuramic acid 6-phosphate etherase n=1 Tax=Thalassococcus sp. BH17M4-6 TaxID=3413148 RepID=UPI003BEDC18D
MTQPHIPDGQGQPIDALSASDALSAMLASHKAALLAVEEALPAIERAAQLVAKALSQGAVLHYAAAGSSGLMALSDGCEIPGTFGVAQGQIRISMAGGVPADGHMPGDTEDDEGHALRDAAPVQAGDVVILVSASGTTPYALAFAHAARAGGAGIVSVFNVATAPLGDLADVAISLPTGAEVVAGSTRLGAGTAQKVVLNLISTRAGILLGHVHAGLMVNLKPENLKLRRRAADIVARIAGVSRDRAADILEGTGHDTKLATLVATGLAPDRARQLLTLHNGRLPDCLDAAATP